MLVSSPTTALHASLLFDDNANRRYSEHLSIVDMTSTTSNNVDFLDDGEESTPLLGNLKSLDFDNLPETSFVLPEIDVDDGNNQDSPSLMVSILEELEKKKSEAAVAVASAPVGDPTQASGTSPGKKSALSSPSQDQPDKSQKQQPLKRFVSFPLFHPSYYRRNNPPGSIYT
jgi:hypothetical protein